MRLKCQPDRISVVPEHRPQDARPPGPAWVGHDGEPGATCVSWGRGSFLSFSGKAGKSRRGGGSLFKDSNTVIHLE